MNTTNPENDFFPLDEEKDIFNEFLQELPENERETATIRLEYVREYVRKNPKYEIDFTQYLNRAHFIYYRNRANILTEIELDEGKFYAHKTLQEQIELLGLKPQPTFDFIAFLRYYLRMWCAERVERCGTRVGRILENIESNPNNDVTMTITVGRKHFTFQNEKFIEILLQVFQDSNVFAANLLEYQNKDVKREKDYRLVKTLLDYLPIHIEKKRGAYTQTERNFSLSVLHYCDDLRGNEKEVCLHNNATFDKLMRDFANVTNDFVGNQLI